MGVIPHALYSDLLKDLSDSVGESVAMKIASGQTDWPEITFRERAASSIYQSLLKKFESGLNDETKRKALDKFLKVDSTCRDWVMRVDENFGDDLLLGEFRNLLWRFWHRGLNPLVDHDFDVLNNGGVGPGSGVGSPGGDFYTKLFSSDLTHTRPDLYFWYKRYIRSWPEWCNAENVRVNDRGSAKIVEGNRLDFVPKNDDISRSICVEPVLNMFYQLGFGHIISSRIEELWGVNLKVQQFKNRELARKGSWDQSFATIDLSSASDSISMEMLRCFLPRDFFRFLERYRSPTSLLPDGKRHVLNMVSTMGNGFTFPLQTMIFTCVVLSAMRLDELAPIYPRGRSEGNFGVNGDDIVIPTRIFGKVTRLLHLLGFTLNADKTFVEGPFRESCGGDYFQGRNLRGVYIKRLHGPQDSFSVVNQLNLFSTRTGILLPRLVKRLLKGCPFLLVPRWENDDSGVKVPFSVARKHIRVDRDTQSILYFALTPDSPPCIRVADSALFIPDSFKPRIFNLPGLYLSFLQGSVNSNTIPLIPKEVRYRRKPRVAPNWDFAFKGDLLEGNAMTIQLFQGWFDWSRWETVAYLNLFG